MACQLDPYGSNYHTSTYQLPIQRSSLRRQLRDQETPLLDISLFIRMNNQDLTVSSAGHFTCTAVHSKPEVLGVQVVGNRV